MISNIYLPNWNAVQNIVLIKCNWRDTTLVTFDDNQTYFRGGGCTLVVTCNATYPVGFVPCIYIYVICSISYKLHQSFFVHLLGHQRVLAGKTRWRPPQPTQKGYSAELLRSPFDHRASELKNDICEYENGLYIFLGTLYTHLLILDSKLWGVSDW